MAIPVPTAAALPALDALYGLLNSVGKVIKDSVLGSLGKFAESLKDLGKLATSVLAPFKKVGDALVGLGGIVVDKVGKIAGQIAAPLADIGAVFLRHARAWVLAAALAAGTSTTLQSLGSGLKSVGVAVGGYLTAVGGAVVKSLGTLGVAFGGVAATAGVAAGAAFGLGKAMEGLVAQANPGVLLLFQQAVSDLMAVVGQALVPIFQIVTQVVRMFADTLSTFMAPLGAAIGTVLQPLVGILGVVFEVFGRIGQAVTKIVEAVAPALGAIIGVVGMVLEAIRPVIDLLVDAVGGALTFALGALASIIEAVVPYVMAFVKAVGGLISWVVGGIRELMAFLGMELADTPGTKPGGSTGAAVRQTQVGSVESYLQSAQTKAFALGTGGADSPAVKTVSILEQLSGKASHIYNIIAALPDFIWAKIVALPQMIIDLYKNIGSTVVKTVGEVTGLQKPAAWVDKQLQKPGVFGFTSLNPFSD